MPPESRSWSRLALAAWAIALVAVCGRAAVDPQRHTLYPTYAQASRDWLAGEDLYLRYARSPQLDQFRYSPVVGALFAPLGLLPDRAGGVLWRLVNGLA